MPLFRDVENQPGVLALQALLAHVPAMLGCRPVARHRQAVQRGHRAAAHQQPGATLGGEVDQFHQPAHHAVLQVDGGVVASGGARVHHCRQELGQHADGRGGRVDPGGEARVLVAHGVRQDVLLEEIQQRLGRAPVLRQRLVEQQVPLRGRHGAIDRLVRQSFEILGRQFDGVVAQVIERLRVHLRAARDHGWRRAPRMRMLREGWWVVIGRVVLSLYSKAY